MGTLMYKKFSPLGQDLCDVSRRLNVDLRKTGLPLDRSASLTWEAARCRGRFIHGAARCTLPSARAGGAVGKPECRRRYPCQRSQLNKVEHLWGFAVECAVRLGRSVKVWVPSPMVAIPVVTSVCR